MDDAPKPPIPPFPEQLEWNLLFQQLLLFDKPTKRSPEGVNPADPQNVTTLVEHLKGILYGLKQSSVEAASPTSQLIALGNSLKSHLLRVLSPTQCFHLANQLNGFSAWWIQQFFGLNPSFKGYFYSTLSHARINVFQLSLERKFPGTRVEGFQAFGDSLPVILTTYMWPWLPHLVSTLGLPGKSIIHTSSVGAMTPLMKPFILIGRTAGEFPLIQGDDLEATEAVAKKFDVWFHLEGNLGLLELPLGNRNLAVATKATSLLFDANWVLNTNWSCYETIPIIFYQTVSPPNEPSPIQLGLWLALQHDGLNLKQQKLRKGWELASHLKTLLQSHPSIEVLPTTSSLLLYWRYIPIRGHPEIHLGDLLIDPTNSSLLPIEESEPPIVDSKPPIHSSIICDFINNVNKQVLSDQTNHESGQYLDLKTVFLKDSEGDKLYWEFNPSLLSGITKEMIDHFYTNLQIEINHIDQALAGRPSFEQEINSRFQEGLRTVFLPNSVVLGATRYLPVVLRLDERPIGPKIQTAIDSFNEAIFKLLQDSKISERFQALADPKGHFVIGVCHGQGEDPVQNSSIYIDQILQSAALVEQQEDFLRALGDLIAESIKEAQIKIKKESELEEAQTGFIRSLPLVGSVVNWWSPSPTKPAQGSSFNLISNELGTPDTVNRRQTPINSPINSPMKAMKPPVNPPVDEPPTEETGKN